MSRWLQSSLADFSVLKMEEIRSSETPVHIRPTWRHIPEDGILITSGILKINILNSPKSIMKNAEIKRGISRSVT
jgi:hypothetical protein